GCRVDLCLVVDNSGSIGQDNWKHVQSFLGNFVNQLTISDKATQVGLLTFAAFGKLVFPMDAYNDDKAGLIDAINSTRFCTTGTNIDVGLSEARTSCLNVGEFVRS
ncbi:hypothetical protein LSH36_194g00037, partial [Paralvinella palmiformis]